MNARDQQAQRRLRRWVTLSILACVQVAALACGGTGSVSPSPSSSAMTTGTIEWKSCRSDMIIGDHPEMRCATITVPLDYANLSGPTAEIALAMLPAVDKENRVGPLLINFGGPGASGINTLVDNGRAIVPAEVGNRFDLITWDPRGVQRSLPVECLTDQELDVWISQPGIPAKPTQSDWESALSDQTWFANKCDERSGDILPYIGTTASARDMESIRAAMEVEKLDYLGYSYGTSLGAVYATLYPSSVGHLILDGAVNPSPTDDSEYGEQGVSIQGALDRLMTWCDEDRQCPFGNGSTRKAMDKLFKRIDAKPVALRDGRTVNATLAWTGIILTLYNREYWDYAVQALDELATGDAELIALLADAYTDRREGRFQSNMMEAFPAINCTDHPTAPSIPKFRDIYERFKDRAPDFASGQAASGLLCGVWSNVNVDPLPDRVDAAGAPPILVIGTTGDPATPYKWSQEMNAALESSVLLTYVGEGHTAIGKSSCIDTAVIAFLVDGALPAQGTRCK